MDASFNICDQRAVGIQWETTTLPKTRTKVAGKSWFELSVQAVELKIKFVPRVRRVAGSVPKNDFEPFSSSWRFVSRMHVETMKTATNWKWIFLHSTSCVEGHLASQGLWCTQRRSDFRHQMKAGIRSVMYAATLETTSIQWRQAFAIVMCFGGKWGLSGTVVHALGIANLVNPDDCRSSLIWPIKATRRLLT